MGAVGNTTTTDPRSRRNRVGRRGGQLLTRALGSSCASACPLHALPVPLVPDGRTIRRELTDPSRASGHRDLHTGYKRHRGAEFQASPGGQSQGTFPQRRGRDETALPGLEPLREGVDHATARVVYGKGPVRRSLRRALHQGHGLIMFNRPAAHEIPDSPRQRHLPVPRWTHPPALSSAVCDPADRRDEG
jgi:hypothetical protein